MNLLIFGFGYTARFFVDACRRKFHGIVGTARRAGDDDSAPGIDMQVFDGATLSTSLSNDVRRATHILVSIPPDDAGDPTLRACGDLIEASRDCHWIGYLSSVAVYGDHGGAWVDESAALNATSERGLQRIAAERAWLQLGARAGKAVHVFRLAGIYGPGRNALVNLRQGRAKRLIKPGQLFNRIHVADIARILAATLSGPSEGGVWNVADDEPAPPQDVVSFAADLLGVQPPPAIPFDAASLTPMAASFYADSKRVANGRMKAALAIDLRYPTYREGLRALAGEVI